MKKLYHVSATPDIKVLEPHVSTHGVSYVYATSDLNLALMFGSKKSLGDFDGILGLNEGKPCFFEAYPNALERRFKGECCYIYEVDPTNFEEGKTSFSPEVVSIKPAKVLKCTKVDDLYRVINKLIKQGKIDFHKFSTAPEYVEQMEHHIKDRIIRFGILKNPDSNTYKFCKEKFPQWIEECEHDIKNSTV